MVQSGIFQHGIEGIYWCGTSAVEVHEDATAAGLRLVFWVKWREPALDRLPKGCKRCLAISRTAGGLRYMWMIRGQGPGCEVRSQSS